VRIITDNILPYFDVVPLSEKEYMETLTAVSGGGWVGAKIYDALLLRAAAKCGAERIYTFNLSDFKQLAPADLESIISVP
jgi:hypothetical protein